MKTGVMSLLHVFVSISDPRYPRYTQHDLAELLTVVMYEALSGASDFVDIQDVGQAETRLPAGLHEA